MTSCENLEALNDPPGTSSPSLHHSTLPSSRHQQQAGGKSITWVNGIPEPTYSPPVSPVAIKQLHFASLALPYEGYEAQDYEGEPIRLIEPRFKGCNNAEVIVRRMVEKAAEGHDASVMQILDRTIGKPKQSIESVNVNMSYQDFLDQLSDEDSSTNPQQTFNSPQQPSTRETDWLDEL